MGLLLQAHRARVTLAAAAPEALSVADRAAWVVYTEVPQVLEAALVRALEDILVRLCTLRDANLSDAEKWLRQQLAGLRSP